jgi:hypothetical protein
MSADTRRLAGAQPIRAVRVERAVPARLPGIIWAAIVAVCVGASAPAAVAPAAAPETPTREPAAPSIHHAVWRARNQIVIDGKATPLFWAVGVADPADLESYAAAGFNTIEIVITAPTEDTWKAAADLAQAAASRDMYVLVTLTPPKSALGGARVSPLDDAYRKAVSAYLEPIVQRASELPGMVGWVIEGMDADTLRFDPADFAQYLTRWHGSVLEAGRLWGAQIPKKLTESLVVDFDSKRPLGIGRASLDLVRYEVQTYADLLDLWANEIHRLDRKHVILAGRQHAYRSAISVPQSCDGMLLGLYPGVAENDLTTHNVQGVDIARRGNQFAALQVLKVAAAPSGAQLASWIAQAVLHGAAGVGFADWSDIRDNDGLRRDIRQALLVTHQLKLSPRVPAAAAAILYEPFAAGGLVEGRPLYGWLAGASIHEPGRLIGALARGTVFGQLDYLSESSLEGVNLDRYGVIVAPLALSLTPAEQAALAGYVARGGTLVADLGIACAQSGALDSMPTDLAQLFGVTFVPGAHEGMVNLMTLTPQPRFPSLKQEMGTSGLDTPASFDPPLYFVKASDGAGPVMAVWEKRPAFAGIVCRPEGKGWAVCATTRLWQDWLPGNPAFDAFHRDLFGLSSPIALKQTTGVAPDDDVGLFEDGSVMLLKRRPEPSEVLLRNPRGTVYHIWGGMEEIRPASASDNSLLIFGYSGLQVAEPVPIEITTDAPRLLVQMVDYSAERVSFALYGPATRVKAHEKAGLAAEAAGEAIAHVRIARGAYRVVRRTRHEIRIEGLLPNTGTLSEVTVGADGVLAFDAPANTVVTVKRAPEGETPSPQ